MLLLNPLSSFQSGFPAYIIVSSFLFPDVSCTVPSSTLIFTSLSFIPKLPNISLYILYVSVSSTRFNCFAISDFSTSFTYTCI